MTGTTAGDGDAVSLKVQVRFMLGEEIAFGPGKADLLVAIAETGSIAAAGRSMGMSYRRAWLLVDTMNRCFREPLVVSAVGGAGGGGAQLSALGQEVLAHYRQMQAEVQDVTDKYLSDMRQWLKSE